ncbi:formimidoylglutamase [Sporosarcina sp. Marseille-Q4063]|uniref:formimidoylglutamase n=1 Tax=Sporosarcina sp. Marseille-Q4063 TaxID=2810514 RepID=UPI001BAEBD5E|nr:formimidoylglutamase [Sporosarcina sp. Marseille-Q4063]QUW23187.1 formimidoylglutamase [Sporosarcina sp. Marseille-Q4063]
MKKIPSFNWNGRTDHETDWNQFRYHQVIGEEANCVLIGFECDEGVRRNNGRVGAAEAPDALRTALSNMAWRLPEGKQLADAGNVVCDGEQLEEAQAELGSVVKKKLDESRTPIILGGGHETFYGHYLGARGFLGKDKKLGIINIDAHFDMRPYDEQPSSGTMFRQVMENDANAGYLVLGIQRYGNTESLFQKADELGCEYIYEDELTDEKMNAAVDAFIANHDAIILTLCMDVLEADAAPGVSAPSPFGLHPKVVRSIIRKVTSNSKTLSFDIAEVNPTLDPDGRTVKLGAAFVNEAIMSFYK